VAPVLMNDLHPIYPKVHPALQRFMAATYTPEAHNEMRLALLGVGEADGDLDQIIAEAIGDDRTAVYVAARAKKLR
jgi:hypothetical protein